MYLSDFDQLLCVILSVMTVVFILDAVRQRR
jgi:hypothetical protein